MLKREIVLPLLLSALFATAAIALASDSPARSRDWDYLGESLKPLPLSACKSSDTIVINYNSGAFDHWQAYCYGTPSRRGARR